MPIAPNMVDPVVWTLYDTLVLNAGSVVPSEFRFFQGGQDKAKTNVSQAERLPDPEWFNCWSIGFQFHTNVLKADIDQLLNNYFYEFWVGQKVYAEGPVQSAPSGYGLYGATAAAGEYAWSNGHPMVQNMIDLRLPPPIGDGLIGVTILQGQMFRVKLIGTSFTLTNANNGGQGMRLKCYLTGILSRGVQ